MELNIAENRNHLNYSKWIYVKRILWTFGKFFFRNSPRIAFGYRNTILRLFGAKIGKHVHIYSSTVIWFPWNLEIGDWSAIGEETLIYNLGKVTIGEKATVSHRHIKDSSFHGLLFFLRLENVFDSGSILEMAAAGCAAPHETLTQAYQQGYPVRQVSLRFQCHRASIDEGLTLAQGSSVIQQAVSVVHGLVAQQGGSAEVQKERLAGCGKDCMIITAFPCILRQWDIRVPVRVITL